MPTTTFSASSMRYYQAGWTSGQARQGFVNGAATRGEITFNFAGTVDVSNIDISQIVLRFTVGSLGGAYTKYLYLHTGSYNGTSVGNYSFSSCYNTTKSKTFSESSNASGFNTLKAYIEGGGTKLGVYTGTNRGGSDSKSYNYDYMNITAMSLDITYTFKKSVGSISSASTGSAATLKITAYNSAYTHKLTWKLGSNSATTTAAAGATSASYTIPHSWLPNAVSGTATVTLETLSGSTSLGSNTYSFAVSVPSSVMPSIGTFTATPSNSGASSTAAGWGLYIQNKTKAALAMGSVSAGSGASITAYSITSSPNYGSTSASSMTSGLLTASGSVTFTAKVTDSRGRTATKAVTITVQAYAAPVFTATPTIYRCVSNGTRDDIEGTYARLTASFSYSSVNSKNSLTVKRVALNGVNTNLTSGTAVTIGAGALAVDNSYSAVITLTDAVGSTTTYTLTVPSAAYVIHVRKGGKSLGIGMAASGTNERLDVKWTSVFKNELQVKPPSNRAYIRIVPETDNPADIQFGRSGAGTWALSSREAASAFFGIYNNVAARWAARIYESDDHVWLNKPLPIDSGGTAANSAASARANLVLNMAIYNDVTKAPFIQTSGSATILAVFNALPDNSIFIGAAEQFASAQVPSTYGLVEIIRKGNARTSVHFYGKRDQDGDWRMYEGGGSGGDNAPSGTWYCVSNNYRSGETPIGVWTDNKRLYRYVCSGSITTTGDITTSFTLPRTPDNVIKIAGAFKREGSSYNEWRPITFHSYAVAQHAVSACITSDNKIHLYVGSSMTGTKKWNLVIEYTA